MLANLSLLALVATATTVSAADDYTVTITNDCDFDLTFVTVSCVKTQPAITLAPGKSFTEDAVEDSAFGSRTFKLSQESNGVERGSQQTHFTYRYYKDYNGITYGLSDFLGSALLGHKIAVETGRADCPPIIWENGCDPWKVPESLAHGCNRGTHVKLTLCKKE